MHITTEHTNRQLEDSGGANWACIPTMDTDTDTARHACPRPPGPLTLARARRPRHRVRVLPVPAPASVPPRTHTRAKLDSPAAHLVRRLDDHAPRARRRPRDDRAVGAVARRDPEPARRVSDRAGAPPTAMARTSGPTRHHCPPRAGWCTCTAPPGPGTPSRSSVCPPRVRLKARIEPGCSVRERGSLQNITLNLAALAPIVL